MARLIFVLGNSGTGKTSSLRNLTKEEASYITVTGKEFPFRSDIKPVKVKTMGEAKKMVEASKKPIVIIDDINYLFTREVFSADSKKNPFEIYDSLSKDFYHLVEAILNKDTEQNFYLMGHLENPESTVRALKTLGQSTRKNNNPEGWTNLVFESVVDLDEFVFKVKTDGSGVKSPMDMFDSSTVENDLKIVNDKINKYYKGGK
jgi:adenylate kinase family enzyme